MRGGERHRGEEGVDDDDHRHPRRHDQQPQQQDRSVEACGGEEKSKLEKMVSDLIRNNESKKQEIAALKMEINRLKVSLRERERVVGSSSVSLFSAKKWEVVNVVEPGDRPPDAEDSPGSRLRQRLRG